ncbi:MAG: ABC transporter ATP-binding protein [Burkholderiales bacterium]
MSAQPGFLRLEHLTKRYDHITAVDDVSLEIAQGEFVCLLGPSGCGKTTTLQMVAGFVAADAGRIMLDGQDLTRVPAHLRGLGIVFQGYALFPHMTVAQNLAFGLQMRKVGSVESARRVAEALEMVHLQDYAQRLPRELSGGQRQRVALARALIIQPPVLLLDEPMGALDAKLREDMQIELRALQRRLGITTVMVTHDQSEAMSLADRVVLMKSGRMAQMGRPHELYEQPNGRFSSTFLGKANIFSGHNDGRSIQVNQTLLPAPPGSPIGAVDCIVRPERLRFAGTGALLQGEITARVFLGNHWLFQIQTAVGEVQMTEPNTGVPLQSEGQRVGLVWSPTDARVIARSA